MSAKTAGSAVSSIGCAMSIRIWTITSTLSLKWGLSSVSRRGESIYVWRIKGDIEPVASGDAEALC
ncbi:MAG: hypothetical protein GKC09_08355 [Methanosarcinales archaeon]|uniref:hypothetical protein n=1 Tax=Methanothrix TaxID=2222 RepID=UPI0017E0AE39|nr:hypothetical protein [Methanothrix soehngenii]MBP7068095.1 hypothetical protein [Methanothrix sp.]NYT09932.1 hypothetical protein [Methanosarcinales archaeon]MDY0413241.1 hypothetical protein [Methanothrix soehngenii]HOE45041.1 hypothetical protein [Methanothrix soehngenii]HOS22936.1 hypothetical protein [Methanothrix soehngenii]